jgi:DNA-binding beta-propeller fold protein YncE
MTVFADTGFSTPYGLAFDSHWNLYVSNQSANTIERFAYDGSGRTTFVGDTGILSSPLGLAIDSFDNLYVANRDTDTIEEFSSTGAHVMTFHTGANPHFLALK